MNSSIVLDCQTGSVSPYCEDCIACKTCKIRKEAKRRKVAEVTAEVVELAAAFPVPHV